MKSRETKRVPTLGEWLEAAVTQADQLIAAQQRVISGEEDKLQQLIGERNAFDAALQKLQETTEREDSEDGDIPRALVGSSTDSEEEAAEVVR